jgi:hypothetical protein
MITYAMLASLSHAGASRNTLRRTFFRDAMFCVVWVQSAECEVVMGVDADRERR